MFGYNFCVSVCVSQVVPAHTNSYLTPAAGEEAIQASRNSVAYTPLLFIQLTYISSRHTRAHHMMMHILEAE